MIAFVSFDRITPYSLIECSDWTGDPDVNLLSGDQERSFQFRLCRFYVPKGIGSGTGILPVHDRVDSRM